MTQIVVASLWSREGLTLDVVITALVARISLSMHASLLDGVIVKHIVDRNVRHALGSREK